MARTNDLIGHVLLCTFALGGKERRDGSTREDTADLAFTGGGKLVDDSGVLLAEATRVQEDRLVAALHPPHTTEDLLGGTEDVEGRQGSLRLGEHHFELAKERRTRRVVLLKGGEASREVALDGTDGKRG